MKIISGGQQGADLGALYGARDAGMLTGGWAPHNWYSGYKPEEALLRSFGLQPAPYDPKTYPTRTMLNVDDSDGTVAILWGTSVGTEKTIGYCQSKAWVWWKRGIPGFHRPVCIIETKDIPAATLQVVEFIRKHNIATLNVAGHREKSQPGIFSFTRDLIRLVCQQLTVS